MASSAEPTSPGGPAHRERVVLIGDAITDDIRDLRAALCARSIDAETMEVAELRRDMRRRRAPGCLVLDSRNGIRSRALLEQYCRDVSEQVLLVTALADTQLRLRGIELGVADYLIAPFVMVEAVARVERVLRLANGAGPAQFGAGDITIDARAGRVMRAGRDVGVTSRELGVLLALIDAAPRIVSKRDLLEQVWDGAPRTQNLVEATVSSLRRKLERYGPRVVQTAHGYGYSFRPASEPRSTRAAMAAERERIVRERDEMIARRDVAIAHLREQLLEARRFTQVDGRADRNKNARRD